MMTRKLTALSVVAAFCAALPASADYNNPTEGSDCNLSKSEYGFSEKRQRLHRRARACLNEQGGPWESSWGDNMACSFNTMTATGPIACQDIEQQQCDLQNRRETLRETCLAKLERYKAEQARLEREREAEEEQREEYQRYLENARRQAGGTDENFATFREFQKMPRKLARALGGAKPTGAYALSKKFSDVGTKHLQGLQQEAMNRLDGAMSDAAASYGPENPRPTAAQRDRALAHFNNAANRPDATTQLPFAGESAVLGANAQALTMIAEARANGSLSQPMATLASVAATMTTIATITASDGAQVAPARDRRDANRARIARMKKAAYMARLSSIREKDRVHPDAVITTNPNISGESTGWRSTDGVISEETAVRIRREREARRQREAAARARKRKLEAARRAAEDARRQQQNFNNFVNGLTSILGGMSNTPSYGGGDNLTDELGCSYPPC